MQDFKCTMPPWLGNFMRPQHTWQMFPDHYGPKHTIPWNTINQGLLQPQGELYPRQPIFNHHGRGQLLKFQRVPTRQLAVSSLSKPMSSTLYFHESIGTDGTWTHNLSHRKQGLYQLS